MSTIAAGSTRPEELERQANATRDEVDRTLQAIENRFSIRQKITALYGIVGAAASRATQWTSSEITTLIRLDHSHVLAAFRRYRTGLPPARKRALVTNVCLRLDIHTQLEEEIFYPALFAGGAVEGELDHSIADHDEMRALIQRLRQLSPADARYDELFYELVRAALHHIADEETMLLPWAEVRLKSSLRELGGQMTLRRLELLKPHMTEVASATAVGFPVLTGVAAVGLCMAAWYLYSSASRTHHT
jgi:hypothetical protein